VSRSCACTTSGSKSRSDTGLLTGWKRPLHVVYVIDHQRQVIVFRTLYLADLSHWHPGYRKRRTGRDGMRDV
jgi:hypothetical protein